MTLTISKNLRLNTVFETLEAMGSGLPIDICQRVALRLGAVQDKAFIRAVYRDLKQLADEGRIIAEVFAPDGSRLSEERAEESKNIRIEYRLCDTQASSIPGWKTLLNVGGRIIPPARKMGWKLSYATKMSQTGHFSLLFQGIAGRIAILQLPQAEFSARILFCRESEMDPLPPNFQELITQRFGLRTLAFVCPNQSVSRGNSIGKMGHAALSINREGQMSLEDFSSKTGTQFAQQSDEILSLAIGAYVNDETAPIEQNPFETKSAWQAVRERSLVLPNAAVIQLGTFRFAVLNKLNP